MGLREFFIARDKFKSTRIGKAITFCSSLRLFFLFWFSSSSFFLQSQITLEADPFACSFFADHITKEELRDHITIISSKEFEGRETGTPGQDKAAQYIIDQLKKMGVYPVPGQRGYFQDVPLTYVQWKDISVELNDSTFTHLRDFISYTDQNNNRPSINLDDVVFLGYGIDDTTYSDYAKVNVVGKTILIYKGEPVNKDSISFVTGTTEMSQWSRDIELKLRTAAKNKVGTVLIVEPNLRERITRTRRRAAGETLTLAQKTRTKTPNTLYISLDMARSIIGKSRKNFVRNLNRITQVGVGRPVHLPVKMKINQHLTRNVLYTKNLVGVIPGTDSILKDQYIALTAHYDHLGKRGKTIFHGADDNGSGTSAVLEILETIAEMKRENLGPRRSILCIFFTAEEKGLLGSAYYSQNPTVPLSQITANVNVDMIGRIDKKHEKDAHYIYVIGSDRLSTDLHKINETTNSTYTHLYLDYTYNEKTDPNRFYYRSDHYNFAKHGIPSIFFFSGVHEDYHKPTDTVDKIMFDKYTAVTRHIFYTVWELAVRNKKIVVDVKDTTLYDR